MYVFKQGACKQKPGKYVYNFLRIISFHALSGYDRTLIFTL